MELDNQCEHAKCRIFNDTPFYSSGSQTLGAAFVFSLGYTLVTALPLKTKTD
jgi:hypothetical protein